MKPGQRNCAPGRLDGLPQKPRLSQQRRHVKAERLYEFAGLDRLVSAGARRRHPERGAIVNTRTSDLRERFERSDREAKALHRDGTPGVRAEEERKASSTAFGKSGRGSHDLSSPPQAESRPKGRTYDAIRTDKIRSNPRRAE